jgi:hypothetical protein
MRRSSLSRSFLLLAALLPFAAQTCRAADPPSPNQPAARDELAFLLGKIRAAHDAVSSGEFLAAEVIERDTVEGEQQRVSNQLRGVFARVSGQTQRRHEFRRTRKTRAPLDQCLVVETDTVAALWTNSGPIVLLPGRHDLLWAEQCPIDPLALGFDAPISSSISTGGPEMWPSFSEFEKWLAGHQAKGHVSVRRDPVGYILSIEFPVPKANGEPVDPEAVREGVIVKLARRITIDATLGFVPTSSVTSFYDKHGKELMRPATLDVTWAKRGEVAVPVAVRTYIDQKNICEERRTITFTWKSVNQPISKDEFDYTKFPAPAGTEIIDHHQRPGRVIGTIAK